MRLRGPCLTMWSVRAIVGDHYQRAAPTPPTPKSIVDQLVEGFAPKAD